MPTLFWGYLHLLLACKTIFLLRTNMPLLYLPCQRQPHAIQIFDALPFGSQVRFAQAWVAALPMPSLRDGKDGMGYMPKRHVSAAYLCFTFLHALPLRGKACKKQVGVFTFLLHALTCFATLPCHTNRRCVRFAMAYKSKMRTLRYGMGYMPFRHVSAAYLRFVTPTG